MMTRREAIQTTMIVAAGTAALGLAPAEGAAAAPATPVGPFTLPDLPYPFEALEPHIDARTMELHHGKHHAAYVANLNKAVAQAPEAMKKDIHELLLGLNSLPEGIRTAVRNNGGGHYNHSLFWRMMKKNGGGIPRGEIAKAIDQTFGSYNTLKEKMGDAALKVFGSGWVWLIAEKGQLRLESQPNQDAPIMGTTGEKIPLLGLDVWEHAYYLKYQNRRADYVTAWFNVVDWDFVETRWKNARS